MDFTSALGSGLISGTVGLAIGMIGLKLFRGRIVAGIVADFTALLSVKENQDALRAAFEAELFGYVQKGLKAVHDDPKMLTPVLKGLIEDITSALPATGHDSLGEMANSPMGDMAMQFLPKKWRGIAYIARMFMGGGSKEKSSGNGHTGGF